MNAYANYRPILRRAILGSVLLSLIAGCGQAPPAASASTEPLVASATHADVVVTSTVQRVLTEDATLRGFGLGVVTLKGDVKLTGTVDTTGQRDQAVAMVRGVPGVHAIHDELIVRN